MGKLAEFLHLNVAGSVRVELEQREFVAGDFLRGAVYVNVRRPVHAEALVVVVTGKEKTSWRETRGKSSYRERYSNDLFGQEIVLASLPTVYEPGDYVYPFQYQLPATLPGATSLERDGFFDDLGSLRAAVWYTLEVRLRARGMFVADLSAHYKLQVHAMAPLHLTPPLALAHSYAVNVLGVVYRGTCDISAVLLQSTLALGATVVVDAVVTNNARKTLRAVALELIQTIDVRRGGGEVVRAVAKREFAGAAPGETFSQALELPLARSLAPTCGTATLFSIAYVLRLTCKYSWCRRPYVEFPVTLVAPSAHSRAMSASMSASSSSNVRGGLGGAEDMARLQHVPLAIPVDAYSG